MNGVDGLCSASDADLMDGVKKVGLRRLQSVKGP